MKELSTEQKAKQYDEALEKIHQFIDGYSRREISKKELEGIFPELKEPEDEKVRRPIIHFISHTPTVPKGIIGKETMLAWLEKQVEPKLPIEKLPFEMKTPEESLGIDSDTYNKIVDECVYGEQKSAAWNEEDKKMSRFIGNAITADDSSTYLESKGVQVIDAHVWLDELKDRVQLKQEWSEEDKEILDNIIIDVEVLKEQDRTKTGKAAYQKEIDWLKSIRPQNNITDKELINARNEAYNDALDKIEYNSGEPTFNDGWSAAIWYLKKRNAMPQSQWKPSKEQMKALDIAIRCGIQLGTWEEEALESLIEQLEQLMKLSDGAL